MHVTNGLHAPAPRGGRGPGGFGPQDMERLWELLDLRPGEAFADLGCGPGSYALEAAHRVGPRGRVWALDQDRSMLAGVQAEARSRHLTQLCTVRADLGETLPLRTASLDLCLLATALTTGPLLGEIRRILRPGGRLALLVCKEQGPAGGPTEQPPIPPEEMEGLVCPHGFERERLEEFGFNYLALYGRP